MRILLPVLLFTVAACSSPATSNDATHGGADTAGPFDAGGDEGSTMDTTEEPDLKVDVDRDDDAEVGVADAGDPGCSALGAADCVADPSCTLEDGCRDAQPDDPLFGYTLSGVWIGTADTTGAAGLPVGATDATLSLFHNNDRDLRGLLLFDDHDVAHRLWGGVGPRGELGLNFGPPECGDPQVCQIPFGTAYKAGGIVVEEERLDVGDVETESLVDEATFEALRMVPSDGFKPVNPFLMRSHPLGASWSGDVAFIDDGGSPRVVSCTFQISVDGDALSIRNFLCEDSSGPTAIPVFQSADSESVAHADGVGWFALGPDDDELLFVGRVGTEGPWEGVVVQRAPTWSAGDPVDPASVDLETWRGTFKFFGLPLN